MKNLTDEEIENLSYEELAKMINEHIKKTPPDQKSILNATNCTFILYQVLHIKARRIAVEIPLFRLAKGIKFGTQENRNGLCRKDSKSRENNRDSKILLS